MPELIKEKFHIVLDRDAIEQKGQDYNRIKEILLYFITNVKKIPCKKIDGDYYYFEQECETMKYYAADILFLSITDNRDLAGNIKTFYWWMEDEMFPFENEEGSALDALTECWKDNGFL